MKYHTQGLTSWPLKKEQDAPKLLDCITNPNCVCPLLLYLSFLEAFESLYFSRQKNFYYFRPSLEMTHYDSFKLASSFLQHFSSPPLLSLLLSFPSFSWSTWNYVAFNYVPDYLGAPRDRAMYLSEWAMLCCSNK